MRRWTVGAAKAAAAVVLLATMAACTVNPQPAPPPSAPAPPPAPPPPSPPPLDLSGKWKLSAAGGATCVMVFGANPGAAEGTIAPAGGCPGNFYTSRKWTFENGGLIIRDFKGEPLARLPFDADHFEGQGTNGTVLTLSR